MSIEIKRINENEIESVTEIYLESFHGMRDKIIASDYHLKLLKAFPVVQYYGAFRGNKLLGYIRWIERGGYRENAVFELEQIAVRKIFREKGIGGLLIRESLSEIKNYLKRRGSRLKTVIVLCGKDNLIARHLYKKNLNARVIAEIPNLFRGDEILLKADFR